MVEAYDNRLDSIEQTIEQLKQTVELMVAPATNHRRLRQSSVKWLEVKDVSMSHKLNDEAGLKLDITARKKMLSPSLIFGGRDEEFEEQCPEL